MASLARYYRTLGLPVTASAKEIKGAYIELCKKCHPDVLKSTDEKEIEANKAKFQEIQEAYSQLISKDGSKNTSTATSQSDAARRAAGFPGRYETYSGFYQHNPYMNSRKRRTNQEEGFNFEEFYRKRYGHEYKEYKEWKESSHSDKENKGEDYFDRDERFWRERRWSEFQNSKAQHRRQMDMLYRAQLRVAAFCILAFCASNLFYYSVAPSPVEQGYRHRPSYW